VASDETKPNLVGYGSTGHGATRRKKAGAVAAAAALCIKHDTTPRGLLQAHFEELRVSVDALTGCDHDLAASPPVRKFIAVPG
jgi:hypothetical protein